MTHFSSYNNRRPILLRPSWILSSRSLFEKQYLTSVAAQIHRLVAPRDQKHQSNFVEFRGSSKVIYRRYAGLFFCACVDANDNELAYLEAIHFFVEVLDQFFGNVCELDLVFNFYKVRRVGCYYREKSDGCTGRIVSSTRRLTTTRYMRSWTRFSWREKSRRRASRSS